MNIFKSFELFLREPLSILKNRIIQIVNVNSSLVSNSSVSADLLGRKAQITVVNSDKMYNLLQTVLYKKKILEAQKLEDLRAQQKKQVVIGQLLKRQ